MIIRYDTFIGELQGKIFNLIPTKEVEESSSLFCQDIRILSKPKALDKPDLIIEERQ